MSGLAWDYIWPCGAGQGSCLGAKHCSADENRSRDVGSDEGWTVALADPRIGSCTDVFCWAVAVFPVYLQSGNSPLSTVSPAGSSS